MIILLNGFTGQGQSGPGCGPGQFKCSPFECIDENLKCNGSDNCSNGEDEQNCGKYKKTI